MSAAEDDTELRDLLIQNLENSGTLNRLKAEMRAAVFLSMEEQDKLENKTPLVNENLKKCLNSRDGRLVASLIMDFLQVFHLDFSLAVFQPEVNWPSGPDSREQVCRELGLSEAELNQNSPLLLELVRRGRHTAAGQVLLEDGALPPGVASAKQPISCPVRKHDAYLGSSGMKNERLDVDLEVEPVDNHDDGDSFFDDPLPKPQKTYGCTVPPRQEFFPEVSSMRRGRSLTDLSVLVGHSENEQDDLLTEHHQSSELRKVEVATEEGGGGSASDLSHSHPASNPREKRSADPKNPKDRSTHLDDEVEYDDDFNSHRSDLSKSELSIGEEIEEVSIEGPDNSEKFDETQDVSVSQLSQTHGVDYMEEVA